MMLPYNILYHSLWYQTPKQIMEEDILKYSLTVMFRETHCISMYIGTPSEKN